MKKVKLFFIKKKWHLSFINFHLSAHDRHSYLNHIFLLFRCPQLSTKISSLILPSVNKLQYLQKKTFPAVVFHFIRDFWTYNILKLMLIDEKVTVTSLIKVKNSVDMPIHVREKINVGRRIV